MPEFLTHREISSRRGQICRLRCLASACGDEAEEHAVLAEVSARSEQHGYERFSLMFHVTGIEEPLQGMYAVTLPGASTQEWFLVPIGRRDGGVVVYEACFNRLAVG